MPLRDGPMRRRGRAQRWLRAMWTSDERGSAIAEFAMISVLLVFLLFAVLQVALLFYVRSISAAAAADGARYGANAGISPSAGGTRATQLIGKATSPKLATQVPCTGTAVPDAASGLITTEVRCRGQIRSAFFPIGAFVSIDVSGQSLQEQP